MHRLEYQDREKLWNAVEKAEKSSDAQLAVRSSWHCPAELDIEQNKKLVKEYVQHAFVDAGMCADIAIHNPPKMNDLKPADRCRGISGEKSIGHAVLQSTCSHIVDYALNRRKGKMACKK